ncbi:MAG TPA: flagellar hook-basal body protein [Solirubrobacteraceae bacterium]|nr:flagellar hook-basal body protein [Solirubrobacteraceae bacterium]HYM67114.1 flagellar hook-basal body protein [Patescibacteria group bacterium]
MLEGLYSAAAGMSAQQEQLDAISNDLANVSTTGYQAERVAFSDLLYNKIDQAGTVTSAGGGARARPIGRSEAQGPIQETGEPLNLAIEGDGYFQLTGPNGQVALTRSGAFAVDASGTIVNGKGDRLSPAIKLPAGVSPSELSIAPDGTVTAGKRTLGQIKLVTVTSPGHMLADGNDGLTPTAASGAPHAATAKIHQGALEQSNVDLGREMALMVSTQRSFQMTSSAIQTESQMMSIANQLRVP